VQPVVAKVPGLVKNQNQLDMQNSMRIQHKDQSYSIEGDVEKYDSVQDRRVHKGYSLIGRYCANGLPDV
jgi:hypothetical protein